MANGCKRDGCERPLNTTGFEHCTLACKAIDREMALAQEFCEATGTGEQSTGLWVAAVTLNDALTEYQRCKTAAGAGRRRGKL